MRLSRSLVVVPVLALLTTGVAVAEPAPPPEVAVTSIDGQDVTGPDGRVRGVVRGDVALTGTSAGLVTNDAAQPTLVADAGDSAYVLPDEAVTLHGIATGTTGEATFAWSLDGATDRFDDASLPSPSLDTTGLPRGPLTVTLTVTDDAGSATDTVLLFLADASQQTLLSATQDIAFGVPEELVDPSFGGLVDGESYDYDIEVPAGASDLVVTTDWNDAANDIDVYLDTPRGPSGDTSGATAAKPEVLTIAAPEAGTHNAQVHAFLSTPDTFTITATADVRDADPRPIVTTDGPFNVPVGTPQVLTGSVTGGTGEVLLEWDTNLDGVTDATGDTVTTTFPIGQHLVSLKATDEAGYEFREVTAVRVLAPGEEVATPSIVVIAVTDSGLNLYHRDWRAETFPDPAILEVTNNFQRHPSEYLTGYPADAEALNITLGSEYFPAQDAPIIAGIEANQLYWVPGTKIVGARTDGSSQGVTTTGDVNPILDEDGHGTASASVAVGNIYGWCPSCLLAAGEGFGNDTYFYSQDWVDIASNSFGNIANVGFTPLIDTPPQTPERADEGQIAMYAAGNGAANAFVVPIQTYLPPTVGADWLVRVGAASTSSDQPIIGDGNPVDISSYGSGNIPSAEIGTTTGEGQHSGTSAATPYSAGALGDVLRRVRGLLGDDTNGFGDGVVADGAPVAGSTALADGRLSRSELLSAFFRTANHEGGATIQFPATAPASPYSYLFEGYGLITPDSGQRAYDVLTGAAPMPDRAAEDEFYTTIDEPIRDALWGDWGGGTAGEPADGAGGSASSPVALPTLDTQLAAGGITAEWIAASLGELPRVTASVADGGVSEVAYANVTTPADGEVIDVSASPVSVFAGDYGVPTASVTPTRHFLRSENCTDNLATPEVEPENNEVTQNTTPSGRDVCGYNEFGAVFGYAAVGAPVETYALPAGEAPIRFGAGQVTGSIFAEIDEPSPMLDITLTLKSGPDVIASGVASATALQPLSVVEVPFAFDVNADAVGVDFASMTLDVELTQAQGAVSYRLNNPDSFLDLPLAGAPPSVEVSLDGGPFTTTSFGNGTWTEVVDLSDAADGAHTFAVRAVTEAGTTTADAVSFVVTRGDATGGGASTAAVEVRLVEQRGRQPATAWTPVVDTSVDGDLATWEIVLPAPGRGDYVVESRALQDGELVATSTSPTFKAR